MWRNLYRRLAPKPSSVTTLGQACVCSMVLWGTTFSPLKLLNRGETWRTVASDLFQSRRLPSCSPLMKSTSRRGQIDPTGFSSPPVHWRIPLQYSQNCKITDVTDRFRLSVEKIKHVCKLFDSFKVLVNWNGLTFTSDSWKSLTVKFRAVSFKTCYFFKLCKSYCFILVRHVLYQHLKKTWIVFWTLAGWMPALEATTNYWPSFSSVERRVLHSESNICLVCTMTSNQNGYQSYISCPTTGAKYLPHKATALLCHPRTHFDTHKKFTNQEKFRTIGAHRQRMNDY